MIALASIAMAAIPTVFPVPAPADLSAVPGAEGLVCEELWAQHASLCFRVVDRSAPKRRLRWVREPDLATWGTEQVNVRTQALQYASGRVASALEVHYVAGMKPSARSRYWLLRDAEGAVGAAAVWPAAIAKVVGGGAFRFALPRSGVAVVWADPEVGGLSPAAAAELDQILSVAAREMYDAADDSVSPTVQVWRRDRFRPFVTAKPRNP